MNEELRKMIRQALFEYNSGKSGDALIDALGTLYPWAHYDDVAYAANYVENAYGLGEEAESGNYQTFADIPGAEILGQKIRIRLYIRGAGMGDGQGATMDVLTIPGHGVQAAIDYGYLYAQEILEQRATLPAGAGSEREFARPIVSVVAIFSEEDAITQAKRTEVIEF